MADVTLTYKGSDILELSDSGSATLKTGGKYCEDDVTVEYVKPSGGGDNIKAIIENTLVDYSYDGTAPIRESLFTYTSSIRDMRFPNTTAIQRSCFAYSSVRSIFAPNATITDATFRGCKNLLTAVTKAAYSGTNIFAKYVGTMALTTVDFTNKGNNGLTADMFNGCENFSTLILRQPVIYPLGNISAFTGTPFASGGTGGTIYIPKELYDHLGDGSSLDYKSATNWSTIDGYGTITWAKIEGSYYETHYADGTVIS